MLLELRSGYHETRYGLSDAHGRIAMNARLRRIDLFCKLAGPLFIALIDGASTEIAVLVTLAISVVSIPIEYFAIAQVCVVIAVGLDVNLDRSITLSPVYSSQEKLSRLRYQSREVHQESGHGDLFQATSAPSSKPCSSTAVIEPFFRRLRYHYSTLPC